MKLTKIVIVAAVLFISSSFLFAQQQSVKKGSNSNKETETSVENEYLNDVDGDIIMSLANSDELDNKLVALQYLQNAIEDGNTSDTAFVFIDVTVVFKDFVRHCAKIFVEQGNKAVSSIFRMHFCNCFTEG